MFLNKYVCIRLIQNNAAFLCNVPKKSSKSGSATKTHSIRALNDDLQLFCKNFLTYLHLWKTIKQKTKQKI